VTDQAQQGREADWHGLLFSQTRPWSPSESKRNLAEPLELPLCPSRIGRCERGKRFRKGLGSALRGKAEKPAHVDPQANGTLLTGQIRKGSHIPAMYSCRQL
jgi:hypothetical protein